MAILRGWGKNSGLRDFWNEGFLKGKVDEDEWGMSGRGSKGLKGEKEGIKEIKTPYVK